MRLGELSDALDHFKLHGDLPPAPYSILDIGFLIDLAVIGAESDERRECAKLAEDKRVEYAGNAGASIFSRNPNCHSAESELGAARGAKEIAEAILARGKS